MFMDNRDCNRYPMFAIAEIIPKGEDDPVPIFAEVSSISESGLGIYCATPIEEGSYVFINIDYRNIEGNVEKDTIEGKVAWTMPKFRLHYIGIHFEEELNPDRQPNLYRHFIEFVKKD